MGTCRCRSPLTSPLTFLSHFVPCRRCSACTPPLPLEAKRRGGKKGAANQPREAKRRGGKTTGAKNATQAGRSLGGKKGAAVLRAKPAAERAAMFKKVWATRRAKEAAAQLAELEA